MNQYFTTLGLSNCNTTTFDQVKQSWRKLVLKLHPDKPNGNADQFKQVQNAYEKLSLYYEELLRNSSSSSSDEKENEMEINVTKFRQCPGCSKVFLPLFSDYCSSTCKACSTTKTDEATKALEEASYIRIVLRAFKFIFTDTPIRLTRSKGRGTAVFHNLPVCPSAIGITTREQDPRNPIQDKNFFYILHSITGTSKYQIKQVRGHDSQSQCLDYRER